MRSRCCSGLGRPSGDAGMSGRGVTCKAPSLAHVVGGSGRSEASPTAILQDTHSLEGEYYEVRVSGVLGIPLARNLDALSRPSLPGLHLLTVASDFISLVSVDGVSAWAATHHVLDGRDVPRLQDILTAPP
jgi:hypothetical protein